ncbi:hypothetical protein SAMN06272755_1947 [Picosynechococcus sp. OG1]|nr:conserved hypothetical protein [Picosynechococcus sp. PCC 7002]SMH48394.1 hypothetical protein SAMN06272755_1947 [Picosynechococcus sp. OG1]
MLEKKKGNSNSMDLLERFETLFLDIEIAYLTRDREFIGKPWLSYLMLDKPIPLSSAHTSDRKDKERNRCDKNAARKTVEVESSSLCHGHSS